ncbi:MAG: hypothetical protein AVDCRST_MAG30-3623, partial [uncultured Solirubrobacteraceae bacterium]
CSASWTPPPSEPSSRCSSAWPTSTPARTAPSRRRRPTRRARRSSA